MSRNVREHQGELLFSNIAPAVQCSPSFSRLRQLTQAPNPLLRSAALSL